jgi:hypothetical protein
MKEKDLPIAMTVVNRPMPKITPLPRKSNKVSTFRRSETNSLKSRRLGERPRCVGIRRHWKRVVKNIFNNVSNVNVKNVVKNIINVKVKNVKNVSNVIVRNGDI